VDYLFESCQRALQLGLLPHTNAGLLLRPELTRLRTVNISMGLMLESSSERLCGRGMPHHRAPDKRPARRLQMMREAGELQIPFTTGILLGIGETVRERVQSLLELRALHAQHGHIQEVIVQRFRSHPDTPMAAVSEPVDAELQSAIALARLILPDEVSVQSPPNLSPGSTRLLIDAGIDDFGGISPITPDYVNPRHPWPHIATLYEECAKHGFTLQARPALHERFARPELVDPRLREPLARARARLSSFQLLATPEVAP
jgi:FO synthase